MSARVPSRRGSFLAVVTVLLASVAASADVASIPVVGPYLRIQQALAADSLDGVVDHAQAIVLESSRLGRAGEPVGAAAVELRQAADLRSARAAFGRLGNAIMTWAADSGAALGEDVHVAYCPMARKHWLQKGEAIRNPFYGASMLDCGRLTPTLPNLKK